MYARTPLAEGALTPAPVDAGEPFSVGVARYRTAAELAAFLSALEDVAGGRLVVVLALRGGDRLPVADLPPTARLVLTTDAAAHPDAAAGWFVPDPARAVVLGLTGLQPGEGVVLLFPADWAGPAPEELVDRARRHRASPHSPVDDVYFG